MQTIKVSQIGLLYTCLFMIFTNINCNIWDNLISQLNSPQFRIPDELKLELFNQDNKAMEILISSKFNLMKFSLINEDLVREVIPNNLSSTVADIYLNFTNGTTKIDFDDSCYFKNTSEISKLTTKFILVSYDILTYFRDTDNYYEYIYTNPLEQTFEKRPKMNFNIKFSSLDDNASEATSLNNFNDLNKVMIRNNIFDKDSMIAFKVNKSNGILQKIALKYKNVNLTDMDVKVYRVDSFDEEVFQIKHECKLLQIEEIDELKEKLNKENSYGKFNDAENKSEKFLTLIE